MGHERQSLVQNDDLVAPKSYGLWATMVTRGMGLEGFN